MQIYKTTNIQNGKIYVGQDSRDRKTYLGSGKLIQRAIKKYGKKNFKKEILEICYSKEELNEREIYWIEKLNSTDLSIGYNIRLGGEGIARGSKLSEDHKKNISLSMSAVWKNEDFKIQQIDKMNTLQRRVNISKSKKGKKLSALQIQALKNRKLDTEKYRKTIDKIVDKTLQRSKSFWELHIEDSRLNEEVRFFIKCRYFEKLTHDEISKLTGRSKTQIDLLLTTYKKMLLS